ncbi:hypothetical protein Z950_591 [Sulfitobacter mediterraneus KCTC 32188]|nr:hypothetical protein Z950_591 [Sulfitobacter mediterraneus KCTC 32188]
MRNIQLDAAAINCELVRQSCEVIFSNGLNRPGFTGDC